MKALIMCGGKGKRLGLGIEKPLLRLKRRYMIDYVIDALFQSKCFDSIYALPGPSTPKTAKYLNSFGFIKIIDSFGKGYSEDLVSALEILKPGPVFVVSSDLPLLLPFTVKEIISKFQTDFKLNKCMSVVSSLDFVSGIGIKPSIKLKINNNNYCHTGVTIIESSQSRGQILKEAYVVFDKISVAVNVNTIEELEISEKLLKTQNYGN